MYNKHVTTTEPDKHSWKLQWNILLGGGEKSQVLGEYTAVVKARLIRGSPKSMLFNQQLVNQAYKIEVQALHSLFSFQAGILIGQLSSQLLYSIIWNDFLHFQFMVHTILLHKSTGPNLFLKLLLFLGTIGAYLSNYYRNIHWRSTTGHSACFNVYRNSGNC